MNVSDYQLLRGFARNGEQGAFAQLVRRHLNLVYATAFSKLQDEGAAQEVAQNVFAALARKAWRFAPDDSLPAWLYKTALLESKRWLRGELRRRRREQTAAELGTTMKTPEDQPALRALVPLLDEGLLSLREQDRTALLLRFYENQPLRELGAAMGVGEDAAQKRVASALGKLAQFFQKRGFKTATVAATAAALQHTASSASTAVAGAVVAAAGQMAPVTLPSLLAPLARLAGLTKVQTAAVCVSLAVVPIGWQCQAQRHARQQILTLQSQLTEVETERVQVQTELDRREKTSARLNMSLAAATDSAMKRATAASEFGAWKNRLRALLTSETYRWPEDSPFVRIPKSVVSQLGGGNGSVQPPGVLAQSARELLGLTPEERQQVESALQAHFAAMDKLTEDHLYETNTLSQYRSHFGIPSGASASKVWVIPALGDEVTAQSKMLEDSLQATLGSERWQLVSQQLETIGTDTLRRVLSLDAGQNPQEIAVWIWENKGKPTVGYGWQGNGGAFSNDGVPLEVFNPGASAGTAAPRIDPVQFIGSRTLPAVVTSRMLAWLQQEAAAWPGKER
jgi:RNA polymerase sigma factor (sigma-70 family)